MQKVTLTINDNGEIIGVDPGQPLIGEGEEASSACLYNGTIDKITTFAIVSKKGHSPCCIITGSGDTYCWC